MFKVFTVILVFLFLSNCADKTQQEKKIFIEKNIHQTVEKLKQDNGELIVPEVLNAEVKK